MSGTPRPRIVAGQADVGPVAAATLAEARESSLYSDPGWLAATDHVLAGTTPFHTVARRRDDEVAVLPAYFVEQPALPDLDPATYLAVDPVAAPTTPASAGSACCGSDAAADAATDAGAAGIGSLLPAVVIGSPLGFHSEPFFTFYNERLFSDMLTATLDAARSAGARAVVAPWLTDRLVGADLGAGLAAAGAATAFWGTDEYIPLTATSPDAHLDTLTKHQRRRLTQDHRRLHTGEGGGATHLRGDALVAAIPAVSELVADTYRRHGTPMPTATIRTALTALAAHAEVHALAVHDTTGAISGVSVLFHRGTRLYVKWAGLAPHAVESGLYFSLTAEEIALGYRLGARTLELGAGSYQAKRLRGSRSRTKTTAVLAFDPATQALIRPLVAEFGRRRRAAAGLDVLDDSSAPTPAPPSTPTSGPPLGRELTLTPSGGSDTACCSG